MKPRARPHAGRVRGVDHNQRAGQSGGIERPNYVPQCRQTLDLVAVHAGDHRTDRSFGVSAEQCDRDVQIVLHLQVDRRPGPGLHRSEGFGGGNRHGISHADHLVLLRLRPFQ